MVAELKPRGIPHLFLIDDPANWREEFLRNLFEEHQIPYLSTKEIIWEDARKLGEHPKEYYYDSHPTARAYRLLAQVLTAHIMAQFDENHPVPMQADAIGSP
jgi:hypothetical protein